MGVDYSAISVIGVCLPNKDELPKAMIMTRKKAFDHDYGEDYEFHPKNGSKLWLDEKEEVEADYPAIILDTEGFIDEDEIEEGQTIIDLTDQEELCCTYSTDERITFYGFIIKTGYANGDKDVSFDHLPDIERIKNLIKNKLEPLNLWDEDEFGLYSILYCSY